MADPFDALRAPAIPVDPDPAFASRLRARIERALTLPRGVTMSQLPQPTVDIATPPAPVGAAIPYLIARDARQALDWYVDVLGGQRRGEPVMMPDGRLGHAEIAFPAGVIYLADEHPEIGVAAPVRDAASVSLVLTVPDLDATVSAAVAAGGRLTRAAYQDHGHRSATVVDPFGHRWMLQTPLTAEPVSASPRHGDLGYASVWVPDVGRAAAFYQSVLGWTYAPENRPDGRRVTGTTPSLGLHGGHPRNTLFCAWAVNDIADAVTRIRAAGGQATEPEATPHGLLAECTDDQGTAFAVYQPPGGVDTGPGPAPNGTRQGDLAYLTLELVDAARARGFYGTVLGWRFDPGTVEDGWQVVDTVPMTGLRGGQPRTTGVPMWLVDDIAAAVRRVRQAGGTATEPRREPYGMAADCADDQGTRFYLGQLPR
ncbi:MAG TPA: VOC family protein [Mycobacteriales bacterium]|nr:VOC family protein [Mycobacteriales bacterium]